jgi:hypothetical protein
MPYGELKPMPSRAAIDQEAHVYIELKARLRAEVPTLDDETLDDTVEGLTSLPDLLAGIVRSHLDDLALAGALRERMAQMRERLARVEARAEKKRTLVLAAMDDCAMRKLTAPDFTASVRPMPVSVAVLDERQIPAEFWAPQPPRLDKAAISAALKAGQEVAGARLDSTGLSLSIRTK